MRKAGAAAREMLIAAAAARWQVAPGDCIARDGAVLHPPTGLRLPFGELVADAAARDAPQEAALRPRSAFTLIGKPLPRLDSVSKTHGAAVFGIDITVPGMCHAAIRHAPCVGAEVERYDAGAALARPGVVKIVTLPGAIAVVAEQYWQAAQALDSIAVTFTGTGRETFSSADLDAQLTQALASGTAAQAPAMGDAAAALAAAQRTVEADYRVPYLAHATLEPINATASVTAQGCEIWAPTQAPSGVQRAAAKLLGTPEDKVKVHMLHAGGGFGRKGAPDATNQAVLLSQAVGRPVKVIWSREEDIQQDFYRPANAARMTGGLDAAGKPVGLRVRVAGSGPLLYNRPQAVKDGLDPMAITGLADMPYRIENRLTESVEVAPPVRIGFWRGTSNSQNTFFLESFIDELAHAARQDPLAFRRALLAHDMRALAVLDLAARKAGWDNQRAQGLAFFHAPRWRTRVAVIADVDRAGDALRVRRLVCVADSGLVVNPNLVQAQLEGGMLFGLSAALNGEITVERGRVAQSNFHDYPVLRMQHTPALETFTIEGDDQPGSFGEVSVPPVAPAVANAVFAATGRRIRTLPLAKSIGIG
jgi:isoquinoline 1-oxidoreductase beta subunit